MTDEGGSLKLVRFSCAIFIVPVSMRVTRSFQLAWILLALFSGIACSPRSERRGIPPEIEAVIGTVSNDIAAERYEKIYHDAADLWKQQLTLEESTAAFKTLSTKLGKVQNRTLNSATEQHNSGGPLKGNVFIVTYQTKFEKGEGMETFTLVERDRQWQLARYFVNSTELK